MLNSAKDDKVEKVQNNGSTKQNQNSSPSGPTGFQPGQGGGSEMVFKKPALRYSVNIPFCRTTEIGG